MFDISNISKSAACEWVGHSDLSPNILHLTSLMEEDVRKPEGFTNSNNQLKKLLDPKQIGQQSSWIFSHQQTENRRAHIGSLCPWLVMMEPYLPLRSRHCRNRRAL